MGENGNAPTARMGHERGAARCTRQQRSAIDREAYAALKAEGLSDRAIARQWGIPQSTFWRLLRRPQLMPSNGAPLQMQNTVLTDALAELSQRLAVVEAVVATMQAQNGRSCTVHALHGATHYALPRFDDPADARAERWNLWIPRGLRRRIEAQARAAGIAPSQLICRLLTATLNDGEAEQ
jgi:Homeodomain-like domain